MDINYSFISKKKGNKIIAAIMSAALLLTMAIVISDIKFYSPKFAYGAFKLNEIDNDNENEGKVKIKLRIDDVTATNDLGRSLASFYMENESGMNSLPKNIEEIKNILRGEWILHKIIRDEGPILSDNLKVKISLAEIITKNQVQQIQVLVEVINTKESFHKINKKILTLISHNELVDNKIYSTEIGLWHTINSDQYKDNDKDNSELIYLKKIKQIAKTKVHQDVDKANTTNIASNDKTKNGIYNSTQEMMNEKEKSSDNNNKEMELQLVEITNKSRIIDVLKVGGASGSLRINDSMIKSLDANFEFEGTDATVNISEAKLSSNYFYYLIDNGQQSVSGAVNRFGEDEYIVTLVNGPYSGIKMKFATDKKVNMLSSKNVNTNANTNDNNTNSTNTGVETTFDKSVEFEEIVQNNNQRDQTLNTEEATVLQNDQLTSRYEEMRIVGNNSNNNNTNAVSGFQF
ncbi:MAG: hypothetical protein HQK49_08335 [Oligoflexia bacterium]|nr:hypothetical protein [Oligoflexia bacterium]